ncbi:hypothetical protein PHLGIDRAFT_122012 [Phlebiopsis gigantea 11061_1 CR5-6]|uniref:Uncharacterized protein n=1 Tax=Phlebiopsis gigantea (strain 11061_1 CR5-6) TaxID=745531 RepID=A0A0C3PCR0_PHLG1|nr:hypothetical protein PHLGIDRAFT_122012 [Phlebiopsis gigantea 11061_1 CR5-6]
MSRTQEVINDSVYKNAHREQIRAAQERSRLILSLAILFQVVAQWGWAIFLFVSPHYSQPECSGNTTIIMFFKEYKTQDINLLDPETGHRSSIWPGWLLFCVGITAGLTVVLAVSSSFRANVDLPSRGSLAVGTPAALVNLLLESLHPWQDRRRLTVFGCHVISLFVWIMLVATSEWQTLVNDIFPGENNVTGLGQPSVCQWAPFGVLLLQYTNILPFSVAASATNASVKRRQQVRVAPRQLLRACAIHTDMQDTPQVHAGRKIM